MIVERLDSKSTDWWRNWRYESSQISRCGSKSNRSCMKNWMMMWWDKIQLIRSDDQVIWSKRFFFGRKVLRPVLGPLSHQLISSPQIIMIPLHLLPFNRWLLDIIKCQNIFHIENFSHLINSIKKSLSSDQAHWKCVRWQLCNKVTPYGIDRRELDSMVMSWMMWWCCYLRSYLRPSFYGCWWGRPCLLPKMSRHLIV
jgi:hypothetical protein